MESLKQTLCPASPETLTLALAQERGPELGFYLLCLYLGKPWVSSDPGIDGVHPVFSLQVRDIAALVSPVMVDEFQAFAANQQTPTEKCCGSPPEQSCGSPPKQCCGSRDLKWLTPKVRFHEQQVNKTMAMYPVIPVQFGTIYRTRKHLVDFLEKGHDHFRAFLEDVRDKEEWGLKVFVDTPRFSPNDGEAEVGLEEGTGSEGAISPGKAFFLRKKREIDRQKSIPARLDQLALNIFQSLESVAGAGKKNKLYSREVTGVREEMILNSAYLVEKARVPLFQKAVADLLSRVDPGVVVFRVTGPWPPYNFGPKVDY